MADRAPASRHALDLTALLSAPVLAAVAVVGLLGDHASLHAELTWLWPVSLAAIAAAWFLALLGPGRCRPTEPGATADGQTTLPQPPDQAGPSGPAGPADFLG